MVKLFFSYKFVLLLLLALAVAAGVATFLESIYDTATAQIFVYEALWYETVMLLLIVSLFGIIFRTKMWRRFGAFVVHFAFIIIAIGAFMTRYMGEEGVLHVREHEASNEMISVKPYLQIESDGKIYEHYLKLAQIGDNSFEIAQPIDGNTLKVKFHSYEPSPKGKRGVLNLKVGFDDTNMQDVSIKGGVGWVSEPKVIEQNGKQILIAWGSKIINLPFSIRLNDFMLERYPGSQSPSSYASAIEVERDGLKVMDFVVFMNNPLTFQGYKLFQSSYDKDERGTVLEVNRDPGKIPTYIGYFLLCVGFVANFFTQHSRFLKLSKFVKNSQLALIFALLVFANLPTNASENDIQNFKQNTANHANGEFSTLLVQDYMGRIKPISTEASEIVSKMAGTNSLFGLSPEQVVLGMSIDPTLWQDLKVIKVKNNEIKKLLNLSQDDQFVSFNFMFDEQGRYKLDKEVEEANEKSASKRGTLENELIKFDERINIAYLTMKGVFFRFIPISGDPTNKWLSPNEAFANPNVSKEIKVILNDYLTGLNLGISQNEWQKADAALKGIKNYQQKNSSHILPEQGRVKAEVLYNKLGVFKNLVYFYLFLGLFALFAGFSEILAYKRFVFIKKSLFVLLLLGFIVHTLGLALRWYVSGHAPWSDSYESMVYIGWSAILAGLVFFRSSLLTISASCLLAAIVMLVAHLSFVNPQITNLVPVLKSYWLTLHVSIITASYGFLGLGCLLGLMGLTLMVLKNTKNSERINAQIRYITAINELSLIVGLSMLTVGNFFGGIWANESWGRYWGWDSKETWSYVSILVYAIVLHLRFVPKLNSVYIFCVASVFAYGSIIMTYFGVNFYLTGLHSYAAGQAPQVPNFIYAVVLFIVSISILALKGKDIKTI
ncbi:cytochrome c biogenesis protein CcsA [Campylobacter sp. 9BO]|uniref:cytochrome c biogenesis protein n=1 Tax=Campylobacter sp. 9BO TaxID=3424759 RepID=UPI003D34F309